MNSQSTCFDVNKACENVNNENIYEYTAFNIYIYIEICSIDTYLKEGWLLKLPLGINQFLYLKRTFI